MSPIGRSLNAIALDFVARTMLFLIGTLVFIGFVNFVSDIQKQILWGFFDICTVFYVVVLCMTSLPLIFAVLFTEDSERNFAVLLRGSDTTLKCFLDGFLGRHQIFKNSPRNLTILRTPYVVGNLLSLFFVICLLGLSIVYMVELGADSPVKAVVLFLRESATAKNFFFIILMFLSFLVAVYWKLEASYKVRWTYCAEKYYQFVAKEIDCDNGQMKARTTQHLENFRISVAVDILQLDQWSKRGFEMFFYQTLKDCFGKSEHNGTYDNHLRSLEAGRHVTLSSMVTERDAEEALKGSYNDF